MFIVQAWRRSAHLFTRPRQVWYLTAGGDWVREIERACQYRTFKLARMAMGAAASRLRGFDAAVAEVASTADLAPTSGDW